jgi:phenylpropionate dioxygenase-like ring-hydroxylating dioxygenase large terminal subunit
MNEQTSKRDLTEQAMRHQWWPVARLDELTKPVAATLLGEKLVVYRTESGRIAVQSSRCPHRGGNFSIGKVHGESIACPYHGWQFSSETGRCTRVPSLADQSKIPPQAAIKTYPAIARYGHVWTVLEERGLQMYDLAEWRDLDLEWLAVVPVDCEHGVAVAMENFRDVSHKPFVHMPTIGQSDPVIEQ